MKYLLLSFVPSFPPQAEGGRRLRRGLQPHPLLLLLADRGLHLAGHGRADDSKVRHQTQHGGGGLGGGAENSASRAEAAGSFMEGGERADKHSSVLHSISHVLNSAGFHILSSLLLFTLWNVIIERTASVEFMSHCFVENMMVSG